MKNLTLFSYDLHEFVRDLAKKSTESDITLYNRKDSEAIYTFISPTKFPDKASSLTDSIFPADFALVNGDSINREFGECLVALDLFRLSSGCFIVSPGKEDNIEKIRRMTAKTALSNYTFYTGTPMEFLSTLEKLEHKPRFKQTTVVIDHFFKVKSVGTVVLGFVLGGRLERHQKLNLSHIDREVQVRSIQVQDEDYESAESGTRVGISLKNVEADEIERGFFLTEVRPQYATSISGTMDLHPTSKLSAGTDFEVFASDIMRFQRGKYQSGTVVLDQKIALLKDEFVLVNPNTVPRFIGRIRPAAGPS
ncbi:GTPase [Thermoplasmatales archaeon AK]|nr:GTPase [Thermoplasmatales archaeon AK]